MFLLPPAQWPMFGFDRISLKRRLVETGVGNLSGKSCKTPFSSGTEFPTDCTETFPLVTPPWTICVHIMVTHATNFSEQPIFGNILLVIMMYSLTGQESWQSIWTKSVPNILGHKYCLETQRNQEESSPFRILLDFSIENFQQQQKSCPVGRFANFADLTFSLCSILSKQCSIDRQHCRTSLFTNIRRECLNNYFDTVGRLFLI